MIYQLTGKIALIRDELIVVDVQGVGYGVSVPTSLKNSVATDQTIRLFTWCHYREDAQDIYGFSSEDDRQMFMLLTSVSGVGPKLGLKLMSEYPTPTLIKLIMSSDLARLTAVSGVGKKVGERLILELKDKMAKVMAAFPVDLSDLATPSGPALNSAIVEDLRMALSALGYHGEEIKRALKKSAADLAEVNDLEKGIKILLKHI